MSAASGARCFLGIVLKQVIEHPFILSAQVWRAKKNGRGKEKETQSDAQFYIEAELTSATQSDALGFARFGFAHSHLSLHSASLFRQRGRFEIERRTSPSGIERQN